MLIPRRAVPLRRSKVVQPACRGGERLRDIEPANPRLVAFGMLAEQVVALRDGRGLCPDWVDNESFVLSTLAIDPDEIVAIASGNEVVAA